jgi:hypothetical protein
MTDAVEMAGTPSAAPRAPYLHVSIYADVPEAEITSRLLSHWIPRGTEAAGTAGLIRRPGARSRPARELIRAWVDGDVDATDVTVSRDALLAAAHDPDVLLLSAELVDIFALASFTRAPKLQLAFGNAPRTGSGRIPVELTFDGYFFEEPHGSERAVAAIGNSAYRSLMAMCSLSYPCLYGAIALEETVSPPSDAAELSALLFYDFFLGASFDSRTVQELTTLFGDAYVERSDWGTYFSTSSAFNPRRLHLDDAGARATSAAELVRAALQKSDIGAGNE